MLWRNNTGVGGYLERSREVWKDGIDAFWIYSQEM